MIPRISSKGKGRGSLTCNNPWPVRFPPNRSTGQGFQLFSFIGFVCEEIIDQCENCGGLYFFEFVSCSAFLLALLLIIVYCTPLRQKVNPNSLKSIDFWISSITGLLFLIASIVFAATMDDISLAKVSVVSLLIGFLCVRFSIWTDYSAFNYFEIVTISFMILIFIFYVINIFRIYRMLTCISWPLAELLHYAIGIFLLFIASIVAAVKSYTISGLVVGSVFGFIATFLCVMDMWLSYKISFTAQSTGATL
uniref:CKLF-like MARVEL transmembrane domain-containing 7 n=1 Tax=Xenopus tropicalis TaxID=8364 RepID=A0A803K823_XENTR